MVVRDVRCMACARLLGRWVIVSETKQGMVPPRKGDPIMAARAGRSLRCKHCGGRAYLEEPEPGDISIESLLEGERQ
ncbi:MAG TPA: hypothetical protein VK009_10680 [Chloroflexota bacterium]|jgi:phage FluMu protein Com|nr:hypothetical protein [Chloroflexota bacterium]